MIDKPKPEDEHYPLLSKVLRKSDLAWIKIPTGLQALPREQVQANGVRLVRDQPAELRCVLP